MGVKSERFEAAWRARYSICLSLQDVVYMANNSLWERRRVKSVNRQNNFKKVRNYK